MKETIRALCDRMESTLVSIRRTLHRIPEPSFDEKQTQARLCSYLKNAGIPFKRDTGGMGVVGLVTGAGKSGSGSRILKGAKGAGGAKGARGPTVALRADMDALNIAERTGLPFASRNEGYMHACGHDAHMAMMLGAGLVLDELRSGLPGNVKLIFQPAEETPPGGAAGMIKRGVLKAPRVDAIIGTHVDPEIPVGKIAINSGPISAAADDFTITITGKGGHGSSPHKTIDAVVVAAQFIMALQTIVSRRVPPMESVVVSVGYIRGGERDNIIAERVEMGGTVRTKTKDLRRRVPAMMKKVLAATCSQFGAKGEMKYTEGYPAVYCDPAFSRLVASACAEILGARRVTTSPGLEMGGEDFAYFAQEVPSTTMFVGVGNPRKGKVHGLHHSKFDIDEAALKTGVAAIAYSAYRFLEKEAGRGHGKGK